MQQQTERPGQNHLQNKRIDSTDAFETHQPLLFSIAYRMLGSVMDAEDIVQEAYLRYQATPVETIRSPKNFLSTVVTRLCLDHLSLARVQRETYIGTWLPEPVVTADDTPWLAPTQHVSQYESISMAFLVLLESLTPVERAVFLLREVFEYEYGELAEIVGKSEAACRQLFSRAKKHIEDNRPRFDTRAEEHRELLDNFIEAAQAGNMNGLMSLLAEDVTFWSDGGGRVRGAATHPVQGRNNVAIFAANAARLAPEDFTYQLSEVNGQSAAILRGADGQPFTVITMEISEGRIHVIHAVANPDKLKRL